MTPYKLVNVDEDYADVWISFSGDFEAVEMDGLGFVHTEEVVSRTDFENDKMWYRTRWFPFIYTGYGSTLNGYVKTGKITGYSTRDEAVLELLNEVKEKS